MRRGCHTRSSSMQDSHCCFNCKMPGHIHQNCPDQQWQGNEQGMAVSSVAFPLHSSSTKSLSSSSIQSAFEMSSTVLTSPVVVSSLFFSTTKSLYYSSVQSAIEMSSMAPQVFVRVCSKENKHSVKKFSVAFNHQLLWKITTLLFYVSSESRQQEKTASSYNRQNLSLSIFLIHPKLRQSLLLYITHLLIEIHRNFHLIRNYPLHKQ